MKKTLILSLAFLAPLLLLSCERSDEPQLLRVQTDELNFWSDGGTNTVGVYSDGNWQAVSEGSWVKVSKSGDDALQIEVLPNGTTVARNTRVKVYDRTLSEEITIRQEGAKPDITFQNQELRVPFTASDQEVFFDSNAGSNWEVVSGEAWVTTESDPQTHRIFLRIEENETFEERKATLSFQTNGEPFENGYTIIQEARPFYYLPFTKWGSYSNDITRFEEERGNTVVKIPDFMFRKEWGFVTKSPYYDYIEYYMTEGRAFLCWLYSSPEYAKKSLLPAEVAKLDEFFKTRGFEKTMLYGEEVYLNPELRTKAQFQRTHDNRVLTMPRIEYEYYVKQTGEYPTLEIEELLGIFNDYDGTKIFRPKEEEYEAGAGGVLVPGYSRTYFKYYKAEKPWIYRSYDISSNYKEKGRIRACISVFEDLNVAFFQDDIGQLHMTDEMQQLLYDNGFTPIPTVNPISLGGIQYINRDRKLQIRFSYHTTNYTNAVDRLVVQVEGTN